MKTNPYLIDFYQSYDEDGRLTSRHGSVEFLTTMHYIEKYLFPGARILEIGAGTGRYSHALARREYAVDAIELSKKYPGRGNGHDFSGKRFGFVCVRRQSI